MASIALARFVREKVLLLTSNNTLLCVLASYMLTINKIMNFQIVPLESHPSKLVGSIGSKNRYFDFDKLAEVRILF